MPARLVLSHRRSFLSRRLPVQGTPLSVTGSHPSSIDLVQGNTPEDIDGSGWFSGGIPPYTFTADGLGDRSTIFGDTLDSLLVTIATFGDPISNRISVSVTDSSGDTKSVSIPVTIGADIEVSGSGDTGSATIYDNEENIAIVPNGVRYETTLEASANGPVSLSRPSFAGTIEDQSEITGDQGYWYARRSLGATALALVWANSEGTEVARGSSYTIKASDFADGLSLLGEAVQNGVTVRSQPTPVIDTGTGGMVINWTTTGMGRDGTDRAVDSDPINWTTTGF